MRRPEALQERALSLSVRALARLRESSQRVPHRLKVSDPLVQVCDAVAGHRLRGITRLWTT